MKKTITFLATAAFSCCGLSPSFAQIQILDSQPTLAPLLVSNQSEVAEVSAPVAQEAISNPFDFFPAEESSPGSPVAAELSSPSDVDPASLPVGRQLGKRTIVDTVIDNATLQGVPNASMAPVFWDQACRTPNPVAEILLRDECNVRDLWAGYPAQRAAECAHMWSKIAGHQHDCGCKSCGTSCQTPVRNRYIQQSQPQPCDEPFGVIGGTGIAPQPPALPAVTNNQAGTSGKGSKVAFFRLPTTR